jgi:transcriptional regulator GlxA family with amidase domain
MSREVEFLAFPDVQLLDVTGPFQVFATANDLARQAGRPAPYGLKVLAAVPGPIRSSSGLTLFTAPLPPPGQPLDTLIVAGGFGVYAACEDVGLVAWITRRAQDATRVASVCSGAFLLAATGLLDGRRVTTHWSRCARLAAAHPSVRVEQDPIYINDGRIWTSAGVTAGIDMALALLQADLGRAAATGVARHLVVFAKRPGGQAQFSTGLALAGSDDSFDRLHDWMAHRKAATEPKFASLRRTVRWWRIGNQLKDAFGPKLIDAVGGLHLHRPTRFTKPGNRYSEQSWYGLGDTISGIGISTANIR